MNDTIQIGTTINAYGNTNLSIDELVFTCAGTKLFDKYPSIDYMYFSSRKCFVGII